MKEGLWHLTADDCTFRLCRHSIRRNIPTLSRGTGLVRIRCSEFFMAEVFISYSRKDKDFVPKLGDALLAHKREQPWVDWKDIARAAEWNQEILRNIETADNFVFVISPESVTSANCKNEINHPVANHKKMVPIFYRSVPNDAIP
jgi:hypothetical protein